MNFFNGCGILLWAFKLYPSLLKGWCIVEMRSVHGSVRPKCTSDSSAWYTCPCPSYIASDLLPDIWAARHLGCWLVDCQCKVIAMISNRLLFSCLKRSNKSCSVLFTSVYYNFPAGTDCRVFDIIINSSFYETIQERPYMKQFLLTIVLEGLEDKYSIRLSRGAGCVHIVTLCSVWPELSSLHLGSSLQASHAKDINLV